MQAIILVHGIMGSELTLGKEVIWPPSVGEVIHDRYERIAKLRDTSAIATNILYQYKGASFIQIYAPIIRELDAIVNYKGGSRPDFWFDWRLNLMHSADLLAQTIANACSGPNPATEVSIVAHSMGGLVARLLLESGKYNTAPWFTNINRFVAVCVPHLGAPIAIARALGLEGSTTISGPDMKTIMNDLRFPTGFQLFPSPPYRNTVLYDDGNPDNAEHPHHAWDIYAPGTAAHFQLSQQNQAAAVKSWSMLDLNSKRPKGVRYISIVANGLSTENKFTIEAANIKIDYTDGDGTVPTWSAGAPTVDKLYTLPGEHIGVMNTNAFRAVLHEIFDSGMAVMPYRADKPGVSISLKQEFKPEEMMEVLLIPDARTTRISGHISIKQATLSRDGESANLTPIGSDVPVTYEGPQATHLSLVLPAPRQPGAYVLTFEGTHGSTDETSGTFFVSRAAAARLPEPKKGKGSAKPPSKPKRSRKAK
jgi:pimeloyl-ACP methyl ester carboxylesterase